MKRKVLFLIVAIIGLIATADVGASSVSRASYGLGYCTDGWFCMPICPYCGTHYIPASGGRAGTGVLTYCCVCQYFKPFYGGDGIVEESMESY
ncbi:MAG: hypothetical protein PHW82_17385 [Bacteroidales bacterium]|nr:hypothetical protein [Bacteroidales bacterium]